MSLLTRYLNLGLHPELTGNARSFVHVWGSRTPRRDLGLASTSDFLISRILNSSRYDMPGSVPSRCENIRVGPRYHRVPSLPNKTIRSEFQGLDRLQNYFITVQLRWSESLRMLRSVRVHILMTQSMRIHSQSRELSDSISMQDIDAHCESRANIRVRQPLVDKLLFQ